MGIFAGPKNGIAVDSAGHVYVTVTSANSIWKYDSAGNYLGFVGASENAVASSANGAFNTPSRIAVDASDNLWVVDTYNHRVQKFNSAGVYQSKFGTNGTGDGQFSLPVGIAINGSGDMWVTDSGNERVQKFNSSGTYQSKFGTLGTGNGQFGDGGAVDVALDAGGNIYVSDYVNERVQKFNSAGTYQSQFGSAGTGNGQFTDVTGIQVDAGGYIYVVDTNPPDGGGPPIGRVQKFDSSYTYLGEFYAGSPSPLSKDAAGNLWLTDSYYNLATKWYIGTTQTDDITVYVAANAIADSATSTATLSPTGDQAGAWLTNTLNPDLAVRLDADADHFILSSSRQTGSLKTSTVAIEIEGSSDYLTPTTGSRRKETWALDVAALSEDARIEMVSLLANDAPLNLRLPQTGYDGLTPGFYSVGDVEPERIGHPVMDHVIVFSLPLTPNRPPVFKPLNQWNMDALAQTGMTMDEVNAAFASMNDLLVGP